MKKAVLLLTFNRLDYLKEVFASVREAKTPRLYIASDGPRPEKSGEKEKVDEVRNWLLSNVDWTCEVKTRFLETNSGGCCQGVSGAITWFFENEEDGIILEDDCVPHQDFYRYCEILLDKYKNDKNIWHISGAAPFEANLKESYYFAKIQHCWGWASWADRWKNFNMDLSLFPESDLVKFGKSKNIVEYWQTVRNGIIDNTIDSWAYRWTFNIVQNDGLCINPSRNLVSNIGEDGVHYNSQTSELTKPSYSLGEIVFPEVISLNQKFVDKVYEEHFKIKPDRYSLKNIIQSVFSIKSDKNKDFTYKRVTILGIRFKINKKRLVNK